MQNSPKKITILGSTGSIGRSTLEVIDASRGALQVDSLSAHSNTELLKQQVRQFRPRRVLVTDLDAYSSADWSDVPSEVELAGGPDRIQELVADPAVDTVVSAIVGSAGLIGTWAALEAGKTVALANKETLVVGGAAHYRPGQADRSDDFTGRQRAWRDFPVASGRQTERSPAGYSNRKWRSFQDLR